MPHGADNRGTTNITGAEPVATSLANRATDSGVTFNLKNDFGAKCDGATDDTSAIQNWLNKAAAERPPCGPGGDVPLLGAPDHRPGQLR